MKKFLCKHKKQISNIVGWTVVAIAFAVVIPIGINWIYKTPASLPVFAMDWEAKDVLAFYGSLLGAVATIFALTSTIKFTVNNQKEERKLSVKPYLETRKYNYTDIEKISDDKDILSLEVRKSIVSYQSGLPKRIVEMKSRLEKPKDISKTPQLEQIIFYSQEKEFFEDNYLLFYEIANCGAGNAINVVLKINNREILPSFCVTTDSYKKLMLVLNADLLEGTEKNECSLKIQLQYSDIASLAEYCQKEEIIFLRDSKGVLNTVQWSNGLLTKPIEILKT